jgi:hypothetical protein
MQHVRVTLTAHGREGEIHPMYGLLTNAPFVERATAMQWNFTGDALGILHYVEGDVDAFEAAVADVDPVVDYELEPAGDGAFYAYIRDATTPEMRDLFEPMTYEGVVMVPPILYHEDGTVSISVFGPGEEIQRGFELVPEPVDITVEEVSGLGALGVAAETRLILPAITSWNISTPRGVENLHVIIAGSISDRQREAIDAALELGYYEIPREASHEDVAAAIDCAPSTAAEHLRKAESTLLSSILRF